MNIKIEFNENYKELITDLYGKGADIINNIPIIFSDEESDYVKEKLDEKLKNHNKTSPTEKEKNEIIERIYKDEKYSTCNLLGVYLPKEPKIIIYLKGISRACNQYNIDFALLTQVVIIHELSHFLSHKYELNGKTWDDDKYIVENTTLHEFLAQYSTYLVVKDNKGLLDAFEELNKHQSDVYRKINDYTSWSVLKNEAVYFKEYKDILIGLREMNNPEIKNVGQFIQEVFHKSEKIRSTFFQEKDIELYDKIDDPLIKFKLDAFNL